MATLFNTKIKDTYQSLLKLEDNTILTTTVKNVTDGLGNASPLYMSTTRIGIGTNAPTNTLTISGITTTGFGISFTDGANNRGSLNVSNGGTFLQGWNNGLYLGTIAVPLAIKIDYQGFVGIGETNPTARTHIKGSGSTSATTSLLVQNSAGTPALTVRDDLYVFGGSRVYSTGNMYMDGNSGTLFSAWGQLQLQGASYVQIMNDTLRAGSQNFTFQNTSFSPNAATNSNLRLVGNSAGFTNAGAGGTSIGNALEIPIGIATSIGNVTLNHIHINGVVNTTAGTTVQRGFYYNPTLTSTVGFTHNAIETVTGNVLLGTTSGFVGIGTSNPTNKLEVIGAARISSTLNVGGDSSVGSSYSSGFIAYDTGNGYAHSLIHAQAASLYLFANPQGFAIAGYEPASSGLYASNLAFMTAGSTRMKILSNGNVLIGTTTDAGEKLQVNGTARVGSTLQLDNGAITWGNASGAPDSRLRITRRTGWGTGTGIEIGALNSNTSAFVSKPVVIGDLNTLADVGTVILGISNNIQKGQTIVIGSGNSIPLVAGVSTHGQIILGNSNTTNGYTNGQVPGIIVGNGNTQNSFAFSQMYGTLLKPYANNQLLFGANAGPVNPSIKEVYIGYGYRNEINDVNQDNGNGNNLLFSPSHASDATDKNGGNLTLAASRGTGAGTPGNLILATAIATTTGTTLQTLVERMRINGSGNVMINTTTDNGYKLNVNGTAFVSELITTAGIVKHNPYTPGGKALEIYSGTGHLGNTGVWASMYSTGVYGNGWDPYYGTQGVGVAGDPNNNSDGGSVLNIGVYGGAALSNATGVYGTSGLFGKAANLRNASAALEVNSTTHGFLPPRMTAAQRSALNTITGFGVITGGSGYVDGTYRTVSITGGSGQNAYARIVISGGSVTSVTLDNSTLGGLAGGFGYTNGASVSASNTQLGGTGAGFSVIINASTPVGMMVYQTDATEGLYIYKSTGWTFIA